MAGMAVNYIRDLKREFSGYNADNLGQDAFAGATVAAVALPLALAFGVGSGADGVSGLISAIIAAFIIGGLSGASFQIAGPTGAMTAVLIPLSINFGLSGVLAAGLISGVILVVAGLCRAGRIIKLIPVPVITGFTSGIAVIIALGQLEPFFGVTSEGSGTLERAVFMFAQDFQPNLFAVAIGIAVILIQVFWPAKWAARIPGSLVGITFAALVASLFGMPVATVGAIPRTLIHESRLTFSSFLLNLSNPIVVAGTSIALLGMIESLLCGVAGGRMKGEKLDVDRELVAQGIGNIVLPFLGGVPATAAIARTSVAIKTGCRTRITGFVQGIVLLLSMFLLAPLMSRIPLSALSGVLMVTAWRMNEWSSIRYIFGRGFHLGSAKFLVTLACTVAFDLTIAIAAGVFCAVMAFVLNVANLVVTVSEIDPARLRGKDKPERHTQVVYVTGPMFFAAMDNFESAIANAKAATLIFSMRGVPYIDISGAHMLWAFCKNRKQRGDTILFVAIQPKVKKTLDKAGITDVVGPESFFGDAIAAFDAINNMQPIQQSSTISGR
ncbi:MAG: SulP family inorganic anion transporter [Synergistaceae bacterium]|jgi:SulP family sulfate permease|nr:SulP family inorganic anion transporter [Synergistaceae bacterium]